MTDQEQAAMGEVAAFAKAQGIGLFEALAILRLLLELKDLPQIRELVDKIKEALSD